MKVANLFVLQNVAVGETGVDKDGGKANQATTS
jgi:hypothetical protein